MYATSNITGSQATANNPSSNLMFLQKLMKVSEQHNLQFLSERLQEMVQGYDKAIEAWLIS